MCCNICCKGFVSAICWPIWKADSGRGLAAIVLHLWILSTCWDACAWYYWTQCLWWWSKNVNQMTWSGGLMKPLKFKTLPYIRAIGGFHCRQLSCFYMWSSNKKLGDHMYIYNRLPYIKFVYGLLRTQVLAFWRKPNHRPCMPFYWRKLA